MVMVEITQKCDDHRKGRLKNKSRPKQYIRPPIKPQKSHTHHTKTPTTQKHHQNIEKTEFLLNSHKIYRSYPTTLSLTQQKLNIVRNPEKITQTTKNIYLKKKKHPGANLQHQCNPSATQEQLSNNPAADTTKEPSIRINQEYSIEFTY